MKIRLCNFIFIVLLSVKLYAQPQGINYQAVIYNDVIAGPGLDVSNELLINRNIGVRIYIDRAVSDIIYSETHKVSTNDFGMIELIIGQGLREGSVDFSTIDWGADNYYLIVEIDKLGGTAYKKMSRQRMWSVPYALYSQSSGISQSDLIEIRDNGNGSIRFIYRNGNFYDSPVLSGLIGSTGDNGNTILHGSGIPGSNIGNNGDFYLDTTSFVLYGPKENTWSNSVSLIGPGGPTGQTGPPGPIGQTGLQGPLGPQGPQGPQGAIGPQGPQGPRGLDSNVPGPQGPQGPIGPSGPAGPTGLQGPQGPVGQTGPAGPNGKNMLVKTSVELSGSNCPTGGIKQEYGLDSNNNEILDPTEIVSSLTKYLCNGASGPQGPAGQTGPQGASGPQGPAGQNGPQGAAGPQGPAGQTGPQGAAGPQGPAGQTGPQGAAGPQGPAGQNGSQGPAGQTGPQGPAGPQGQQGQAGPQGPQGPVGQTGPAGANGMAVLNGTSNPTGAIGVNGDFYINTTNKTLFGPKSGGIWPAGVSLTGATGPQGPTGPTGSPGANGTAVLNGTSNPTGAIGVNGDFYINTTNKTLFGPKSGGVWPAGVSLTGATGPQGPAGQTGPSGPAGKNTLIKTTIESQSLNCAAGGVKLDFGLDLNNNDILDITEIDLTLTRYICNGAPGTPGSGSGTLPSGSEIGVVPFWDGIKWVTNNLNFFHNGVNVGIGTFKPDPSSIVDIKSTSKGLLIPRMSEDQRDLIPSPADGLIIYNLSSGCLNIYKASRWVAFCETVKGSFSNFDCQQIVYIGTLLPDTPANGVSFGIPYMGGNGGSYSSMSFISSNVTTLSANLSAGQLSSGNGVLFFQITGTPPSGNSTKAEFEITIDGKSCLINFNVGSGFSPTTVHCDASSPTDIVIVTNPFTGKTWMDRNLGARRIAESSDDLLAYGDLFQWGRQADGHQCRSPLSGVTSTLSDSDIPDTDLFIMSNTFPFDWRIPQNNNLWNSNGGKNNPCPNGYRVPTATEWNEEIFSWSERNAAGAFNSSLKLVLSGLRDGQSGNLNDAGIKGNYWSSTSALEKALGLNITSTSVTVSFDNNFRSNGATVRCIKQ